MATWIGGKNGSGSYQQIISEIPMIDLYVEPFFGSGAVWSNMRRPRWCVVGDVYPSVLDELIAQGDAFDDVGKWVLNGGGTLALPGSDVFETMSTAREMAERLRLRRRFVYFDPPYLFETRKGGERRLYDYEFGTEAEHARLLDLVVSMLPGWDCAISGYWSRLYAAVLDGWRVKTWRARTRRGVAVEYLWMNYPVVAMLQDGRYVGSTFIDRQRLRRLAGVERR